MHMAHAHTAIINILILYCTYIVYRIILREGHLILKCCAPVVRGPAADDLQRVLERVRRARSDEGVLAREIARVVAAGVGRHVADSVIPPVNNVVCSCDKACLWVRPCTDRDGGLHLSGLLKPTEVWLVETINSKRKADSYRSACVPSCIVRVGSRLVRIAGDGNAVVCRVWYARVVFILADSSLCQSTVSIHSDGVGQRGKRSVQAWAFHSSKRTVICTVDYDIVRVRHNRPVFVDFSQTVVRINAPNRLLEQRREAKKG